MPRSHSIRHDLDGVGGEFTTSMLMIQSWTPPRRPASIDIPSIDKTNQGTPTSRQVITPNFRRRTPQDIPLDPTPLTIIILYSVCVYLNRTKQPFLFLHPPLSRFRPSWVGWVSVHERTEPINAATAILKNKTKMK